VDELKKRSGYGKGAEIGQAMQLGGLSSVKNELIQKSIKREFAPPAMLARCLLNGLDDWLDILMKPYFPMPNKRPEKQSPVPWLNDG
jgi:hypothetical protein